MTDRNRTHGQRWWPTLQAVLSHYPEARAARPADVVAHAGGFSGSVVWRVRTAHDACCLRGWPPGAMAPHQLEWLQQQLLQIAQAGCRMVPRPHVTRQGTLWVIAGDRLWEMSSWLPGEADDAAAPAAARLVSAATALAQFHAAACGHVARPPRPAVAPSLSRRLEVIAQLQGGLWETLCRTAIPPHCPGLESRARPILEHAPRAVTAVAQRLRAARSISTPLQVCHGDLWRDHVLFSGDAVTGLIDFGAMRVDARATDIARLLGSLAGDAPEAWRVAIAAYEQVTPLGDGERTLVRVLDESAVLLSGISWLRWLLLEQRRFPSWQRVLQRLDAIIPRLRRLADASG